MKTVSDQPVSRVEWVHRDELSANDWNPNRQAPPETRLLATSILENGWTQPIVVREAESGELEIVDGYHRWTVSARADVRELTDGLVPIVKLAPTPDSLAKMATIRHNRARGVHYVLDMANIVAELAADGIDPKEIGTRLGMDDEEVTRLLDRGDMLKRAAAADFNTGWTTS